MRHVIEEYYKQASITPFLLKQKMNSLERNPEIMEEFAYWISNKQFKENPISVHGYTAEQLSSLSEYLLGEGAFMLLIELKENQERGAKRIAEGFTLK